MYKIINKGRYPFHVGDKTLYKGEELECEKLPNIHQDVEGIKIYENGKLIDNVNDVKVSPKENQVKKRGRPKKEVEENDS